MHYIQRFLFVFKETIASWNQDKASRLAAALAYYTIFSITPLLIIIISITGLFLGERSAHDEVAVLLEELVGSEAAVFIQTALENFSNPASGIVASLLGLGTLVIGATGLFHRVQEALNTIWKVDSSGYDFLYYVKQRFIHLGFVAGIGTLLLLYVFADIAIATVSQYLNLQALPKTLNLNFITYPVMTTVLFTVLYKILPETKTTWLEALIGAALASFLFNIGRFVIGLYLRFSTFSSAYGAAGSLVVLLVWIYYSAQIFLLGAEFMYVCAKYKGCRKSFVSDVSAASPVFQAEIQDIPVPIIPQVVDLPEERQPHQTIENEADLTQETPIPVSPTGSKRMMTAALVAGTLFSSIAGLNWLHRKRKRKNAARDDA